MDQIGRLQGQSTRARTYKCYNCRKPFTVKVGTIFEHSKVPMYKWLQAMVLYRGYKDHVNANQLCKVLGVTYKTAKTMLKLIRNERAEGT
jgi:transposase-like protein